MQAVEVSVGGPVLVSEAPLSVRAYQQEVLGREEHLVPRSAVTDLDDERLAS